MIKAIAAYQIREERCLIFPWASGGNLRDYWRDFERKSREKESLQWIFLQLVGISSALEKLHENNCRHGDLKPENILWFKDSDDMGTLQIADLGVAAFHEIEANTKLRQMRYIVTDTPSGTSRYEPPEMNRDRSRLEARSRQYDIWSMGCIFLELLVWLTCGEKALETFRRAPTYFWQLQQRDRYVVHPYVASQMDFLATQLQDDTAYKELLHLVRTRLLVVKVSETYESKPECREIAKVIHKRMEDIQQKCRANPSYLEPVQLEYPSDETLDLLRQADTVYENDVGLATPPRTDVAGNPHPLLSTNVPQFLLRTPTLPSRFERDSDFGK